ncbi:hypothetical protein ASPTUDRAFT_46025 [Aspergillus tubingensis CBS 134.48]|uniref:Uncharacterized protein n=1 Tax=Aspergillus tubingensis (strain CBS 134.48) TaxID=767770 RepID=A0A1L9MUU0_ASPTC|nr:hypothetical protein ASPTUDRAFT_46025 [Aspergillus tubingensis CBS 134.48]
MVQCSKLATSPSFSCLSPLPNVFLPYQIGASCRLITISSIVSLHYPDWGVFEAAPAATTYVSS